jgi:transposase
MSYPPELRKRAVRMVAEVRPEYPSDWPAICAVAGKLGIGSAETLRKWVRQAEVNAGARPGVSSEESAEIRRLRQENAELRRANEIPQGGVGFLRVNARIVTARRGSFLFCCPGLRLVACADVRPRRALAGPGMWLDRSVLLPD